MEKTSPRRHPQEEASFVSRIMLWWIIPLLWKGWRHPLQQDDLHPVRDKDQSCKLTKRLEEKWEQEKDSAKKGRTQFFQKCNILYNVQYRKYRIYACMYFLQHIIMNPLIFVQLTQSVYSHSKWHARF